jgi:hypothetical protein
MYTCIYTYKPLEEVIIEGGEGDTLESVRHDCNSLDE